MDVNSREFWLIVHLILGVIFIHAFAGGLTGILTSGRSKILTGGTWVMAMVSWITVITGTYIVYPWYRAKPPEGVADLSAYPRSYFLANPDLVYWHKFAMEWKEHVGWFSPILATAVAFSIIKYGPRLLRDEKVRKATVLLFTLAFVTAGIAGMLGALINKVSPNLFLDI